MRLSLAEAVERALTASARLRELEQLRVAAGADVEGARAERWPTAEASARATPAARTSTSSSSPSPPASRRSASSTCPTTGASRHAPTCRSTPGGASPARSTPRVESERAAGLDLDASRRALVLETEHAYWQLLTARESERVLREGLGAFQAHLKDARNRERFGLAARSEVLAVEVEHERAELRRLRAENAAEVARGEPRAPSPAPARTRWSSRPRGSRACRRPTRISRRLVQQALGGPPGAGGPARPGPGRRGQRAHRPVDDPAPARVSPRATCTPTRTATSSPPTRRGGRAGTSAWRSRCRVFDGGRTSASVARARAGVEALRQRLDDLERHIRLQVDQRPAGDRGRPTSPLASPTAPWPPARRASGSPPTATGKASSPPPSCSTPRSPSSTPASSAPGPWPTPASPLPSSTGRWAVNGAPDAGAVELDGLTKRFGAFTAVDRPHHERRGRARSSASWAPTAPASPPPSACSAACSPPPRAPGGCSASTWPATPRASSGASAT